jgi:hypothetical protein
VGDTSAKNPSKDREEDRWQDNGWQGREYGRGKTHGKEVASDRLLTHA